MKRIRNLWISIIFVMVLVVASLLSFTLGDLKPKLGLDLQGGVQVILSAPAGTPPAVMNQALSNIRNRVDAFGVGESTIFVSGTTITVQIPGGGEGSIETRDKTQFCVIGPDSVNYGCSEKKVGPKRAVGDLAAERRDGPSCIYYADGKEFACYNTKAEADSHLSEIQLQPKSSPTPAAPPGVQSQPPRVGDFCLTDAGIEVKCYANAALATDAKDGLTTKAKSFDYCVVDGWTAPAPEPSATPTPSTSASASGSPGGRAKKSKSPSVSSSKSPSASTTASPTPTVPPTSPFSKLTGPAGGQLPLCGYKNKAKAEDAKSEFRVAKNTKQWCVTSSGGQDEGCYITRADAVKRRSEIGVSRLVQLIGQTARLEERPVVAISQPGSSGYETTQITCYPTGSDQAATAEQSPDCGKTGALDDQSVVYVDQTGIKYTLGPVTITGSDFKRATATLDTQTGGGWTVQFQLKKDGASKFADATTVAKNSSPPQNQIAIAVDRLVISSPTVQSPITNGDGQITGNFSEEDAKGLATQLNSGSLPVELAQQALSNVSPTLGSESLRQGIIAGLVGLVLLFLYMVFYYRLLGVVAWLGMSIWAILALGLISLAGDTLGYALSLAGIAGLVISLGVTADSYIVFFERLKDEVRNGKTARVAVQPAFKRAYRTIVAADLVTGIAALVLYLTAVSSVRGFALTLGVATALDLFVVWFFKRPTIFLIARNERLVSMRGFGLSSGIAAEEHGDRAVATQPTEEGA